MSGLTLGQAGLWGGSTGLKDTAGGLWSGKSGLQSGAGAPPVPPPPPFTVSFNFLTSETLDGRITASGGVGGTRINSAGVIVAASCPRYDYDPVTLALRGVLVEDSRTNLMLNATIDGANLANQSIACTINQVFTISFYGDGSIQILGGASRTITGVGLYPARTIQTFTATGSGFLTLFVTGTVQYAQIELASLATSYIPTGSTSVTRTADVLSVSSSNFTSWFNASSGTIYTKVDVPALTRVVYEIGNSAISSLITQKVTLGTSVNAKTTSSSTLQSDIALGSITPSVPFVVAHAYALNDIAASLNGGTPVVDTVAALPISLNTLNIGSDIDGVTRFNGHFQSFAYIPSRVTDAQLQYLSGQPAPPAI